VCNLYGRTVLSRGYSYKLYDIFKYINVANILFYCSGEPCSPFVLCANTKQSVIADCFVSWRTVFSCLKYNRNAINLKREREITLSKIIIIIKLYIIVPPPTTYSPS